MGQSLPGEPLRAPFQYFGGKSAIAATVWRLLGQPRHYLEPFFGSGAVLLARPAYDPSRHIETVCDSDGFLCNVWRSLQFAPEEVARWCDWPVNHADLMARKAALLRHEGRLLEHLVADDRWHDPVMAGYWVWAKSCSIGAGLTRPTQRPHISDGGSGVHATSQIPHLSAVGMGVQEPYSPSLWAWFRQLSERLRRVRVVCGDWTRICGGHWQANMGQAGLFFDPPYGVVDRDPQLYHRDSLGIAADVRTWCLARGAQPDHRIVIAGYEEHAELLAHGWTRHRWRAHGGYGNLGDGRGRRNRHRETLYASPHCLREDLFQATLDPVHDGA